MPFSQIPFIALASILLGGIIFVSMLAFSIMSIQEEAYQAAKWALALAFLLPLPWLAAGLIDYKLHTTISFPLLGLTMLVLLFLMLPIGNTFKPADDTPKTRVDERDIMFSRNNLKKGSDRFNEYYDRHPELKILDDKFRSQPGLMQKGAAYYDPITSATANASFKTVGAFHVLLDDENLPTPAKQVDPVHMTHFIKQWLKGVGAVSVGVTELMDYHLYHTIGRGDRYGQPVDLNHKYGIALTVEMNKYLLDRAPGGPTVMESAQEYLNSGAMAVQLAEFIRQFGYSARAHIDGSYRVVCPLVGRDAGLGEIGRMGLLMTPELGPRVRLAVVTTDLPLIPNGRKRDDTVFDFCRLCKKCADVCPGSAISFDDREEIDGALRWQINSEACFTYWCKVGTDCGRCMSVCPYSHPNNAMHNVVRFTLKRSALFRLIALKMDDLFYGRKPAPLHIPDWIKNVAEIPSELDEPGS
ncbi:MAG: 4Fe-4S dicluster domain-containing protein [Anaerolineales bacterium]|nr:4Fe-4S dicluster domain-containing protein [Anaerolineales bacterium]